ncbi:hypothetical protein [Lentibacillus amyloliquefaciens]|uniref:Uncharacterized protein n=1 Tax=Lentibacillus amyloliquefaciens TaxID=1472767 RepID=A0A0U3W6Z9_9BACI|nr:hypothetical protein [Lentibacillus amyloliquefaciens]ALX48914.1 hypothetical protein AOX59_09985 [Lentibacillus amyloliquefaciens]
MRTNPLHIYTSSQKPVELHAERVALYLGSGIIEAFSKHNETYYLFFYKHEFLTAAKAKKLKRHSFIASAFKQGMVFNAPHPFIDELLASRQPHRITRFDPLLKKLDKQHTPHEKAFILTFFESFISKKRLFNEIKSIFYSYRRNGQNFLAYKIVRVLMDFAPDHSLVKELSNDWNYRQYAKLYHDQSENVLDQDLIFAEKVFYDGKRGDDYFQRLTALLNDQSRWMEMIALYGERFIDNPSDGNYAFLKGQLDQKLDDEHMMNFLGALYEQQPRYAPLNHDLLQVYVDMNNIDDVLNIYVNNGVNVPVQDTESMRKMLEQLDLNSRSFSPEKLKSLFELTISLDAKVAEQLIHNYAAVLLETYNPSEIKEMLNPLIEYRAVHPVYQKMDALIKFNDDLDRMQQLGELYYEFRQYDEAIDCFSWETELKPDEPEPLKWLAKMYQKMGMEQESEAYRQLLVNQQKKA